MSDVINHDDEKPDLFVWWLWLVHHHVFDGSMPTFWLWYWAERNHVISWLEPCKSKPIKIYNETGSPSMRQGSPEGVKNFLGCWLARRCKPPFLLSWVLFRDLGQSLEEALNLCSRLGALPNSSSLHCSPFHGSGLKGALSAGSK